LPGLAPPRGGEPPPRDLSPPAETHTLFSRIQLSATGGIVAKPGRTVNPGRDFSWMTRQPSARVAARILGIRFDVDLARDLCAQHHLPPLQADPNRPAEWTLPLHPKPGLRE